MNKSPAAGATKTIDHEIAERILHVLKEKKSITQEALSQEIGISYTSLRRGLEQHRGDSRSFTFLQIGKIAEALEVQPSALIPEWVVAK